MMTQEKGEKESEANGEKGAMSAAKSVKNGDCYIQVNEHKKGIRWGITPRTLNLFYKGSSYFLIINELSRNPSNFPKIQY